MKLVGLTVADRADFLLSCMPDQREGVAHGWISGCGVLGGVSGRGDRRGLRCVAVSGLDGRAAGVADGNSAAPNEHF